MHYLGVTWDTVLLEFTSTNVMVERVRDIVSDMLYEVRVGRRWVLRNKL